jgi:hypothetical protein
MWLRGYSSCSIENVSSSVEVMCLGNAEDCNVRGAFYMRIWISIGMLMATTVAACAIAAPVPEIDAFSGVAAMGVVGSIAALIWERRRK